MIITLDMSYDNEQYINIILKHIDKEENHSIFYAEFNDFDINKIQEPAALKVINNLKFEPPDPDEDEYFIWSKKPKNVELRESKDEIRRYIEDWLKDICGCAMSWVDYTEYDGMGGYRNIRPVPEDSTFEIWVRKNFPFWGQFCGLWSDSKLPNYIKTTPNYLSS